MCEGCATTGRIYGKRTRLYLGAGLSHTLKINREKEPLRPVALKNSYSFVDINVPASLIPAAARASCAI